MSGEEGMERRGSDDMQVCATKLEPSPLDKSAAASTH